MLRSLLFFILICTFTVAKAQYEPQFSQNMFNQMYVNPGFAGSTGLIRATALNRIQWVGVEGAPKTMVFSADGGLKFLGYEHGIGFTAMSDKIGSYTSMRFSLSYSFKMDVGEGQLSPGVSVSYINQVLNGSDLKTNPDLSDAGQVGSDDYHKENDLLVPTASVNGSSVDLGLGVYYSEKDFYGGFSIMHLNQPKPSFNGIWDKSIKRTWFLTGGYVYDLVDQPLQIEPSIFIKSDETIYQVDLCGIVKYKKRFWGGLSYRFQDAIIVLVGIELKNGLKVGYSYDFNTSKLSGSPIRDNEVVLSYSFSVGMSKKSKQYRSVRYL